MLRCTVPDRNAIKKLQGMPNFAASMADKAASPSSSSPCLISYPPPPATINRPNIALPLIYLAIIKWIGINCLRVTFFPEQQNWSIQGHLLSKIFFIPNSFFLYGDSEEPASPGGVDIFQWLKKIGKSYMNYTWFGGKEEDHICDKNSYVVRSKV